MRSFVTLFLSLVFITRVVAQQVPSAGAVHTNPSVYVIDSLNKLSSETFLQSPDSAMDIAFKALLLAEKEKYRLGAGYSYYNIGHVYWSQSYYPIALIYLNKALLNFPKKENLLIS